MNKINFKPLNYKKEEKKLDITLKNPISRAIKRHEIKRHFNVFFKNVRTLKHVGADDEIVFQCSGIYKDYDNPHYGNMFHFKDDREIVYAVFQCLYLYHFRKYGITVQLTREAYGEFLFYVYGAYQKGGIR